MGMDEPLSPPIRTSFAADSRPSSIADVAWGARAAAKELEAFGQSSTSVNRQSFHTVDLPTPPIPARNPDRLSAAYQEDIADLPPE
jgi:hypothetical protein